MRTETIVKSIYPFNELSDDAKNVARDWFREVYQHEEWWDTVYEDAKQIATILGIEIDKIYFSGFSCQGDGAQFTGSYSYAKGSCKAIRSYAPQDTTLHDIADNLYQLQRKRFYGLTATVETSGHYNHEFCTQIDTYQGEDTTPYVLGSLNEALRDFMCWIYKQLEKEYDWIMSDENVDESILCNDYEFNPDGTTY